MKDIKISQIVLIKAIANYKPALNGFIEKGIPVREVQYDLNEIIRATNEQPSVLVVLFYNNSVLDIASHVNCPIIVWLADKVIVKDSTGRGIDLDRFYIFTFDASDLEAFKTCGFRNSHLLPCCSGFEYSIKPGPIKDSELKNDVSFVGDSITVNHNPYFQWILNISNLTKHLDEVINKQVGSLKKDILKETYDSGDLSQFSLQYLADYLTLLNRRDLEFALGCEASSRIRKKLVQSLDEFDLHVYGDRFWEQAKVKTIKFHSETSYPGQTAEVFRSSKINLNISRIFFTGAIQRIFDILYCQGFCITDEKEGLSDLFELGKEIEVYENSKDLVDKVRYYLEHENERLDIAQKGYARLLKEHRARHRINFIVKNTPFFN